MAGTGFTYLASKSAFPDSSLQADPGWTMLPMDQIKGIDDEQAQSLDVCRSTARNSGLRKPSLSDGVSV